MPKDAAPPTRYPIRAVSRLTGIGIDTLRAWERRHHAIAPTRDHRGRMYSAADVARLRLLQEAVAGGHAIGRLATLSDGELRRLSDIGPGPAPAARPTPAIDIAPLIDALERFDALTAEAELARFAALLRPSELLRDVVVPALEQIGDAGRRKRAPIAHEHLLSAIVRNVLGSLLRLYSRSDAPGRLLFATPRGERHELGTLGAAVLAASGGLGIVYLGADLPGDEIVDSAVTATADVVVLGVTMAEDREGMSRELARIATRLPADVELWVGGRAAGRFAATVRPRGMVFESHAALEEELERVGARL